MRTHQRPIVVDLFAGAGGLSLGFEQAGMDVLAAVEIDPVHASTHEFNFPYAKTFCSDIRKVSAQQIRQESLIGDNEIFAVIGGAPCQGFSLIGKRALDDPRNMLVREFVEMVLALQPRYFVLENVAGLTIGKHRQFLVEIMEAFEQNNYHVRTDYQVLQAAEYGVPQSRKRLFLLGARDGEKLPEYPAKITTPRTTDGRPQPGNLPLTPSVWDALSDLPEVEHYPELFEQDWIVAKFGEPSEYAKILRDPSSDDSDLSRPRPISPDVLTSSLRTRHTDVSIRRFSATRPGEVEPVSRFLRLHPSGVSNTLRAGTASDRGAFTSPRPIHPIQPRCITVREAARLHGYPDWFRFHSTKWHGFRQIGNSVPPPLARQVAQMLLRAADLTPGKGERTMLGKSDLLYVGQGQAADRFGVDRHVIPPRHRSA
jgi:DNA (cytosine-5)-methyltransferase 1